MSDGVQAGMVLDALKGVVDSEFQQDIVALGMPKQVAVADGRVTFTLELPTPAHPARERLQDQAQAAVAGLPGVTGVDMSVTFNVKSVTKPEHGKTPLPGVKNVIAVGAGKGGVGKSTVSVNLALALAQMGAKVGILDGDLYGPNVPLMFGLTAELGTDGQKIAPAEKFGVQVVSMAFLAGDDQALIWRGPMLHSAIRQFFTDVSWKDLDYLIIDMPPGTGDVALSLSQTVQVAGAVVDTTPQIVSLADTRRAVRMYEKLSIPPLGLVENMSYYACPNCHIESDIFGHGGGEQLAAEMNLPFLGRLPVYQPIRIGGDRGIPLVVAEPNSPAGRGFFHLAERVAIRAAISAHDNAIKHKGKIPLIQVR
ncbi:MAG TPA: Mrp/NBP35 family ATP-binding protein [Vicinamibacterales bacterium]|nr:Mrp/NBP35 family ATP-binding protein [Vicinamibacterales bacterium]